MRDNEISQFSEEQLENLLNTCYEGASFDVEDAIKDACMEIAKKYNNYTGALGFNAINAIMAAAQKDQDTLLATIKTLKKYDFPKPDLKDYDHPKNREVIEHYKYMHPELKANIIRKSLGLTKDDMNFFEGLYDKLGVKPQGG